MGKVARDNTLQIIVDKLVARNNFLTQLKGNLENLITTDKSSLTNAINELYIIASKQNSLLTLKYNHDGSDEYIECTYRGNGSLSVSSSDTSIADVELDGDIVNIMRHKAGTPIITVTIAETETHFSDKVSITIPVRGLRFGYRIKESESDPYARVEYLYDAEGMTPAKMLSNGTFDYGSWRDIWFVKDNKPLMLNSDGTIAYYLNPNNYALKEDGTSSDIANTSFDGNAMAQMPLVWFKRYSENGYHYEIVSNVQYDDDYKAYAHTRADGTIAPYFYYSMFGGSNVSNKLRSLSGQSLAGDLNVSQLVSYATANGSNYYIGTWSQHEYLRTLLVLMGKSTNSQAVFGNGNATVTTSASALLKTNTLNDKGQFYGSLTANNVQVKIFHIEMPWGDIRQRTAGILNNNGKIYVKMTREGLGYQIDNINGYIDINITLGGTSGGFIKECLCSEYGLIPKVVSGGSATTYYCDCGWYNNSGGIMYLTIGNSIVDENSFGGIFNFHVFQVPTGAVYDFGARISCEMPST